MRESIRYRPRKDDRALELVARREHRQLREDLGGYGREPEPVRRGEQLALPPVVETITVAVRGEQPGG